MFRLRCNLILLLAIMVPSCSDTPASEPIAEIGGHECTKTELVTASNMFLEYLLNDDVDGALKFYAKNHQRVGPGYGVNYTFFPNRDPEAVFDIKAKNKQSAIFSEDLGVFENGRLVGFFQSSAIGQTKNIEYLSQNHWDSFVVCNFVCIDGEWKISEYTCFEDSGSPFE